MAALARILTRMENGKALTAIKKGFIVMTPILMTGALALLLQSFPLPAFQQFLSEPSNQVYRNILNLVYGATYGMLSLCLVISVSYQYAGAFQNRNHSFRISAILVSTACFALSFPTEDWLPDIHYFGPDGVFMAMVCAVAGTRLFGFFYANLHKQSGRYDARKELDLKSAIAAILPMIACVAVFLLGNGLIRLLFSVNNVNELITKALSGLFHNLPNELIGGILFILLLNLLWLFGIHGGNVLDQVAQQFFVPLDVRPDLIISKSFMDNFALPGGCGGTICLLLALLFMSKTQSNRRLARACFPFAIFNINELLVFGFPLVLNPVMAIPFLLVPLCSLVTAYLFTAAGLLPIVQSTITWTTPVLFSGYAATQSVWGIAVQVLNISIGTLIYIPFLRLSEKMQKQNEAYLLSSLVEECKKAELNGSPLTFLDRQDAHGTIARQIVGQLRADVEGGRIPVYYQPQVNARQEVCGAEALLRWGYAGGPLYPPLVVSLALEDHLFNQLTQRIMEQVLSDLGSLTPPDGSPFLVSANISAEQLNDPLFIQGFLALASGNKTGGYLGLEVTEATSLIYLEHITQNIEALKRAGVPVSIDDFSMGQTSLKYLQNNSFAYVKLDGALVMESAANKRSQDIISSIIQLGKSLHFQVIAEHVETRELQESLQAMGCDIFQGYLYGKAVPAYAFRDFYRLSPECRMTSAQPFDPPLAKSRGEQQPAG